jgi:8-amino-7-oxononanoate synthase
MSPDLSPTRALVSHLHSSLLQREREGLLRTLVTPTGLDLTSNDYLDYRRCPELVTGASEAATEFGAGAGASRLLRGQSDFIATTERELAAFSGREAALLYSSGFAGNIGLIGALAGPEDQIFSDALNHASLIDGIRLAGAPCSVFRHQDFEHLRELLTTSGGRRRLIITESLFSMDGDLTDLRALATLAEEHQAVLIVDEAHSTGIYGERGSGRVEALGLEKDVLCTLHTGGKALGTGGAWVAGDQPLIDHLVNHSRSFIYSTAPVPPLVGALRAAVRKRAADPKPARELLLKAAWFRDLLRANDLNILNTESQVIPVMIGESDVAVRIATDLAEQGFDVRAVRPPTVPPGTARLRLTLRSSLQRADLARLQRCLTTCLKKETP